MNEDTISRVDHEALMKKQREHHRLRMRQEVDRLANDLAGNYREALADLVRLKDGPRDDAYRAEKDAAWDRARHALASMEIDGP